MNHAWLSLRTRSRWFLSAAGLALLALLSACGFQMRGETPLPFNTLYVGVPHNTHFGANLRRAIRASSPNTQLVDTPKQAQVLLQQVASQRLINDTSLNAQGQVEEYELGIRFTFRVIDAKGNAILPDTTFTTYRELPYNTSASQALSSLIDSLYASMEQSLISRILRRLDAADVRENYARLQRGDVNPDRPVYDVDKVQSPQGTMPPGWNNPPTLLDGAPR
ncbi:MAG TPA: LPS assembly lipoprotein LptE [Bordetella sp.]|uniref:LPS-assembly lipoprotein LptE n=1 Tax=Bordetella sp. TaxID=28081 RepID=UPI002ECFCCDE